MSDDQQDHKRYYADVFDTIAAGYDQVGPRFFSTFGRHLVNLEPIPLGARVLDVACGRGAVLYPAAECVGAAGLAVGVDISGGMVRQTRDEAQAKELTCVHVAQMDGENLAFPAHTFDRVYCSAALGFFPDHMRGLREFYRVLKLGGMCGITLWKAPGPDHDYAWVFELFRKYKTPESARSDTPIRLREPPDQRAMLTEWLTEAGFTAIRVAEHAITFPFADEHEFWAQQWNVARRVVLERTDPTLLDQLKDALFAGFQKHKQPDGRIPIPIATLFAYGTKPPVNKLFKTAEVSFDHLEMRDDMYAIEGTYRLPGRDWEVFTIFKDDELEWPTHKFYTWPNGITGVMIRVPKSTQLNAGEAIALLITIFEIESWVVVRGPDSMWLR